jgi:hypothetical protein
MAVRVTSSALEEVTVTAMRARTEIRLLNLHVRWATKCITAQGNNFEGYVM